MAYCKDERTDGVLFPSEDAMEWFLDKEAVASTSGCEGEGGPCVFTHAARLAKLFDEAFPDSDTFCEMLDEFQDLTLTGAASLKPEQVCDAFSEMDPAALLKIMGLLAPSLAPALAADTPACAALVTGIISSDPANTIRPGNDGKLFENDAVI